MLLFRLLLWNTLKISAETTVVALISSFELLRLSELPYVGARRTACLSTANALRCLFLCLFIAKAMGSKSYLISTYLALFFSQAPIVDTSTAHLLNRPVPLPVLLLLEFRSSGPLQSEEGLLPLHTKDATLLFLHSCQASSPSDVARLMESPIGRRVHGLLTARILTWRLVHQRVTAEYPRATCKNWAHLLVCQLSIFIFFYYY